MLYTLHKHVIPAAYSILPPYMESNRATAMLLAIALQESNASHRRQVGGPAKGFWQFERAGVLGVLNHVATGQQARQFLMALQYAPLTASDGVHEAIEHNDILAAGFARLLLWTLPQELPGSNELDKGWDQYIEAWRPGKPRRDVWDEHFFRGWARVLTAV